MAMPVPRATREAAQPPSDMMTVAELAVRLRMSVHGVGNAIRRGEIPGVVRVGRRIRISRRVVERWLHGDEGGR